MKKILLLIPLFLLFVLVSCDTGEKYEGKGRVIFYLEGGSCQNTTERFSQYYDFAEGVEEILIYDPNVIITDPKDQVIRNGYHIEGWYQTKNTSGDEVTYSDRWDFATDKITKEGVTLYAKWERNVTYTYALYYINSEGEEVKIDSYVSKVGAKFNDLLLKNKTVDGYTSLGYVDQNGNPWDTSFVMPEADTNTEIKVYLDLIEGEYTVVKKASELSSAIKQNKDIYLANDIDFDGKAISFDDYSGLLEGNGHKIYNATYSVSKEKGDINTALKGDINNPDGSAKTFLYVSTFYELNGATIQNVSFEDITFKIDTKNTKITDIIIAPLAIKAKDATINNVSLDVEIVLTTTLNCYIETISDQYFYVSENNTIDSNTSLNVSVVDNRSN